MSNNYLKFLLSIAFCLNLFLGYYFVYDFFIKKENNDDEYKTLLTDKENKIESLDKVNKKNQKIIDSLNTENTKNETKVLVIRNKIKQNKKDEQIIRDNINNMDADSVYRELSETKLN